MACRRRRQGAQGVEDQGRSPRYPNSQPSKLVWTQKSNRFRHRAPLSQQIPLCHRSGRCGAEACTHPPPKHMSGKIFRLQAGYKRLMIKGKKGNTAVNMSLRTERTKLGGSRGRELLHVSPISRLYVERSVTCGSTFLISATP